MVQRHREWKAERAKKNAKDAEKKKLRADFEKEYAMKKAELRAELQHQYPKIVESFQNKLVEMRARWDTEKRQHWSSTNIGLRQRLCGHRSVSDADFHFLGSLARSPYAVD